MKRSTIFNDALFDDDVTGGTYRCEY